LVTVYYFKLTPDFEERIHRFLVTRQAAQTTFQVCKDNGRIFIKGGAAHGITRESKFRILNDTGDFVDPTLVVKETRFFESVVEPQLATNANWEIIGEVFALKTKSAPDKRLRIHLLPSLGDPLIRNVTGELP
jgi:hypothetical protein